MPRYWRDQDDDTVHLTTPGVAPDEGDVIVITAAQWRRLVEYMNDWMQSCPCDGACDVCVEEGAIKAIIDSVEGPHD